MMSKRKLTQQQQRRIAVQHDNRLMEAAHLKAAQEGLLIVRHGAKAWVENEHEQLFLCSLRQNLESPVAGDRVIFRAVSAEAGVITAIQPRHTVINRLDANQELKPLAANVDQFIIVIAVKPEPSMEVIDRYLVAAASLHLTPIIVCNKVDLQDDKILKLCALYENIGYTVVFTSVIEHRGLDALKKLLVDKTSIFVGQSGVGKSSLIQALIPEETLAIGKISELSELGKHTTTASRLYHFKDGGDFIDSPGVRRFNLWAMTRADIFKGFVEFKPYEGRCKFRNCEHTHEPGCALQEAVKKGDISLERLNSFHHLVTTHSIEG